ncbi:MAG: prephenate dehydratase [Phycisphaerae bacterium]
MSKQQDRLTELRERIDRIDEEVVRLVNDRASVAAEIARLKHDAGDTTYTPAREREVLDKVVAQNEGPLADRTLQAIYRELMSGSFPLVRPPRIGYLGPPGSYSHLAATRKFGASAEYEPLKLIATVFDEIEREHVDLGVVPIENSAAGGVIDTLNVLARTDVRICAEVYLPVQHHLLANCSLEKVKRVYSKPEVFAQCQKWLSETGLISETVTVSSSSKAAELAAAEQGAAAVASELAGKIYGLHEICNRIEDDPNNVTRFLVIGRKHARPTGNDKTALMFEAADRPGALVDVLDVFRQAGINMTFIESRPSPTRKFEYSFFVDIEGHLETPQIADVIEAARAHCSSLRVLGSFPHADEVL